MPIQIPANFLWDPSNEEPSIFSIIPALKILIKMLSFLAYSYQLNLDFQHVTYSATLRSNIVPFLAFQPSPAPLQAAWDLQEAIDLQDVWPAFVIWGVCYKKNKAAWEHELSINFIDEGWKGAIDKTHTSSFFVPNLDSYSSISYMCFIFLKPDCLTYIQR